MKPSEKAKLIYASMNSEPVSRVKSASCCCKIAPWQIGVEDRGYTLRVTRVGVLNDGMKYPEKEPPSNADKKRYELHIVLPPLKEDGSKGYRGVKVDFDFLKKSCDLRLTARTDTQETTLYKSGVFRVDSDGMIEGAEERFGLDAQAYMMRQKSKEPLKDSYAEGVGRDNICISGDTRKSRYERVPNFLDIETLREALEKEGVKEVPQEELQRALRVMKQKAREDRMELSTIVAGILNPDSIAKKIEIFPEGSSRCELMPRAYVVMHDKIAYKGEVSLSYGFMHTTAPNITTGVGAHRNERIDVTRSAFKAEGRFEYIEGTKHYIIEPFYGKGIDANGNRERVSTKRKYRHLKRIGAENIFKGLQESINGFHRFFDKAQKAQRLPFKIDTGLTKFGFGAEGSIDEDPNGYGLINRVDNLKFEIAIFDGSNVTLDLIELGLVAGGGIGVVLSKARRYAKEHGQEVRLDFSMGGGIKGSLNFKRAQSRWSYEGMISGSVNIEILGKVHLEGSALWVSVAAGTYVKSASKDDIDEKSQITATLKADKRDESIALSGDISFNGMTIYYAAYLETSAKKVDNKEDNAGSIGKKKHIQTTVVVFDSDDRWDLIDSWQSEEFRFKTLESLLS